MIAIIDFGSSKVPAIEEMVGAIGAQHITYKWDDIKPAGNPAGFILSGAPLLLTIVEQRPYLELFKTLLSYQKPILGICFGHQLMALHFGSSVFLGPAERKSISIEIDTKNLLFDGLTTPSVFKQDHTEGISTIPDGFTLTGRSANYIEAIAHQNLPLFGVQFHPEVSGDNGEKVIGNFLRICS